MNALMRTPWTDAEDTAFNSWLKIKKKMKRPTDEKELQLLMEEFRRQSVPGGNNALAN